MKRLSSFFILSKCQRKNTKSIKIYWLYCIKKYSRVDVQNIHSKNNAKI